MNIDEVVKQKLSRTWPESWALFEESCKFTIEKNLTFIKGGLLYTEHKIEYGERDIAYQELIRVLKGMGYENIATFPDDQFLTKDGWKGAYVFVCFLSRAAIDAYMKENEVYNKWNRRDGPEPKRPIYEAIKSHSMF